MSQFISQLYADFVFLLCILHGIQMALFFPNFSLIFVEAPVIAKSNIILDIKPVSTIPVASSFDVAIQMILYTKGP